MGLSRQRSGIAKAWEEWQVEHGKRRKDPGDSPGDLTLWAGSDSCSSAC